MQLAALENFDQDTANAILAASSLVQAGTSFPSPSINRYKDDIARVLREVRELVGEADDLDAQNQAVRKFLSEAVYRAILADDDLEILTNRLGAKGELPLSAYKVGLPKEVIGWTKEKSSYIKRMVSGASDYQHIVPDGIHSDFGAKGATIFVHEQPKKVAEMHWLLVVAMRYQDILTVTGVFRVFPSVVNLNEASDPLTFLTAFSRHYGAPFTINGGKAAHCFTNVDADGDEKNISVEFPKLVGGRPNIAMIGSTTEAFSDKKMTKLKLAKSNVALAFSYNRAKYVADRMRLWGK